MKDALRCASHDLGVRPNFRSLRYEAFEFRDSPVHLPKRGANEMIAGTWRVYGDSIGH